MSLRSVESRVAAQFRERRLPQSLLIAIGLVAAWGCTERITPFLGVNRPPTIEFTHAPIASTPDDPAFYAYRVFWSAHDPDGRVDHVEYCVDPTPTDSVWVQSDRSDELIFFSATEPDLEPSVIRRARSPHVLAVRAVDQQGARSPVRTRAFYSYTVAPSVQIVSPVPSKLLQLAVLPSLRVEWQGQDPDGQFSQRPVSYRYRLLSLDDEDNRVFLNDADSLRRRDAPNGFADWDSSGADTLFARYTNLTPSNAYLFAVVGFDEAGAYSPVFSLNENMLQMYVTLAASNGPRIHVWNSFLDFTYPSGGYTLDPSRWIPVEAPYGESIEFNWDAIAPEGTRIDNYRWALDLSSLGDPNPREDEERDYRRWSRRSPLTTSCVLTGLSAGTHLLYIEATDNNGFASLGVVELTLVEPTFDKEILIVDDTRLEPDKPLAAGCMESYKKGWPSATELDTFLFARGGAPWRCTVEPASGVTSVPGVFAGYSFDTLGTRLGLEIPTRGVPLVRLTQYRHVVWLVDRESAANFEVLGNDPMSTLRYMSAPGRASTLGAYVRAGGRVWLCGGGAGTVTVDEFNRPADDFPDGRVYSATAGDLAPGRLMWDAAQWRSAFTATIAGMSLARAPRAEAIAAAPWSHADTWTGGELRAPDYLRLPAELRTRSMDTDPMPPTRAARQTSSYYTTSTTCEYLIEQNHIVEDVEPADELVREASTLDTLIEARSVLLRRSPAPAMTWYHGPQANRFVFSGFAPWAFRRGDCIALTDFVLQDLWGLTRNAVDRNGTWVRNGRSPAPAATRRAGAATGLSSPVTLPPVRR